MGSVDHSFYLNENQLNISKSVAETRSELENRVIDLEVNPIETREQACEEELEPLFSESLQIIRDNQSEIQRSIQEISFEAFKGKIEANDKQSDAEKKLEKLLNNSESIESLEIFEELFGASLVEKVREAGLFKNWIDKNSCLQMNRQRVLEMFAAIGQVITMDDLQDSFVQVKEGHVYREILLFLNIDPMVMREYDSIRDLPQVYFERLLHVFRNPISLLLEESSVMKELGNLPLMTSQRYALYTHHDEVVHGLIDSKEETLEFSLACREQLAKLVAYAEPKSVFKGCIIPVIQDGQVIYYELEGKLSKAGVHSYLFVPIHDKSKPAVLLFRGTDGVDSIQRDLDSDGIGKTAFNQHASKIAEMLEDYIEKTGNVELEIIGHSLGAADAQRIMEYIVNQMVYNVDSSLKKLKEIKSFAYCSPKLDKSTVLRWKRNLSFLAETKSPCNIVLNFVQHRFDLVTWCGDRNLTDSISDFQEEYRIAEREGCLENLVSKNSEFVEINYLLVDSLTGFRKAAMHHTHSFFLDNGKFDEVDGRFYKIVQSELLQRKLQLLKGIREDWLDRDIYQKVEDCWWTVEGLTSEERERQDLLKGEVKKLAAERNAGKEDRTGLTEQSNIAFVGAKAMVPLKGLFYFTAGKLCRQN